MGRFHTQDFGQRYQTMGDGAEGVAERVVPRSAPFGFNRPPFSIQPLPKRLRYTPDRVTPDRFLECMGVGRDGIIKVKHEKLSCSLWWDDLHPVDFLIFDSHRNQWGTIPAREIQRLAASGELESGRFQEKTAEEPEGRAYWKLPISAVDNWTPVPPQDETA